MSLEPLDSTLLPSMGVTLVGAYTSAILFGLTSHQVFRYFRMFPRDHFILQRLVLILWCLIAASSIFIMHQSYYYLVSRRLQINFLVRPVWSIKVRVTRLLEILVFNLLIRSLSCFCSYRASPRW
ncbi:hypothetical protein SCHPADRAFT_379237 [Schizopora paradoxa]|uniref:Uncharacterized protein n=1 Tax=Schizopora paradoxa TaxID=27342 RepID=A0A0H2RNF1_9AGAM|nr:hypothetical protein SCHPADRAFT_379237 [Schizopora paradoxa]